MQELNRKLSWLMATRVIVMISAFFAVLLYSPAEGSGDVSFLERVLASMVPAGLWSESPPEVSHSELLQVLVGVISVQTLIYAILLRVLRDRPRLHGAVQICGDLLLITLLIYKFGGVLVALSVLYFAEIALASFVLRGRAGLLTAGAVTVLFSMALFAHQNEKFRSLWESGGLFAATETSQSVTGAPETSSWTMDVLAWLRPPGVERVSGVPAVYSLAVHLVGFFTVAFFTSYLASDPMLERQVEARRQELATLKSFHEDVVQSISSGLAVTDLDGVTQSLNRAGEEILGRTEKGLAGRHISTTGLCTEVGWRQLAAHSLRGILRSETTVERRGARLHIGFTLSPFRDGQDHQLGYILIFQDLTQWRALQDKVRLHDRMAALGQMAAGLAHEVGNPLAAISGSVQLLSKSMSGDPAKAKLLDITLKESRRLDRTVKSFLQFAKPRDRHAADIDVAALLAEDTELLRNSEDVGPRHQIVLDLEPTSAIIYADVDQIGQLFWNLARNALQAMPDGGTLTVRGRLDAGLYRLEVEDTGRGMTEDERSKLFQPFKSFFDSGLGLGMAICYRIVEEHRGEIRVESTPGAGTTILVELPVDPGDEEESQIDDETAARLRLEGSGIVELTSLLDDERPSPPGERSVAAGESEDPERVHAGAADGSEASEGRPAEVEA